MVKSISLNKKIKKQEISPDFDSSNAAYIKIQCPDCGTIFVLNKNREYYCVSCRRTFLEDEIRSRCGL